MTKEDLYHICIQPPTWEIQKQVQKNWDAIAKPLGSMGQFETIISRIGAIIGSADIETSPRAVLVFCADNGIVEEGVSQSGQEVTKAVADSMLRGRSSVCKMADLAGIQVKVIDIGMCHFVLQQETGGEFLARKVADGTKNFLKEPAMTEQEALQAIQIGIELVATCKQEGYRILAMGEMGIGNTTTSSAVTAALLNCDPEDIVGRGAGISEEGFYRKREVIKEALQKYKLYDAKPLTILATVGGLDIAGLAGMCIGGAIYRIPIVVDGVISAVAALIAERLVPGVREYLIPSHKSKEPAAEKLMEELGLYPILDGQMALGEGTGAVMMLAMLDMALSVYKDRTVFAQIGVEQYRHFETETRKI